MSCGGSRPASSSSSGDADDDNDDDHNDHNDVPQEVWMTHVQADGKRDVFSPAKAPGKQYSVNKIQ